ncbi:MAG: PaaI family thioesterase [Acinetobacter towneri]
MTKEEIIDFLKVEFPQSLEKCEIVALTPRGALVNYLIDARDLRPGGTVSGPTMMTVADYALYIAILGELGLVALAVTSNLNINFLRKPAAGRNLRGECRLMKVGKNLVVGEVWVYSEGVNDAVAHVTGTYSIPQV